MPSEQEVRDRVKAVYERAKPCLEPLADEIEGLIVRFYGFDLGHGEAEAEEMNRLYGVYKISSRVKTLESLDAKINRMYQSSRERGRLSDWLTGPKFMERDIPTDPLEAARSLAVTFWDLIGIRIVCFTQRQKHRTHQRLHRYIVDKGTFWDLTNSDAGALHAQSRAPRLNARYLDQERPYWIYYNPQPAYLTSSDYVQLTSDNVESEIGKLFRSNLPEYTADSVGIGQEAWQILAPALADLNQLTLEAFQHYIQKFRDPRTLGYGVEVDHRNYSSIQTAIFHDFGAGSAGPVTSDNAVDQQVEPARLLSGEIAFECQIRTLLEDAWSEPEHERVYKGHDLSLFSRQTANVLGAHLRVGDELMQSMFDSCDLESSPKMEVFLQQQSESLTPKMPPDQPLEHDLRRLQWLQKEGMFVVAFVHAGHVRDALRQYELEGEAKRLGVFFSLIQDQVTCLLNLYLAAPGAHSDSEFEDPRVHGLNSLATLYEKMGKLSVDLSRRSVLLTPAWLRALKFTANYRRSLVSFSLSQLDRSRTAEHGTRAYDLAIISKDAWGSGGKASADILEVGATGAMVWAWLRSMTYWCPREGFDDPESIAPLTEMSNPDGSENDRRWATLWAYNVCLYSSMKWEAKHNLTGSQDTDEYARDLTVKFKGGNLSNTTRAVGEYLLGPKTRLEEVSLGNWSARCHVGHLKVIDTLLVYAAWKRLQEEADLEAIRLSLLARAVELALRGWISTDNYFIKILRQPLDERVTELSGLLR